MSLRGAALVALACSGACANSPDAPADLALPTECRPVSTACGDPCSPYADSVARYCAAHVTAQIGTCGGYDVIVVHNGISPNSSFYDHASGAFVADRNTQGSCDAPPGFVFPTCNPNDFTPLCPLDFGVTD